MTQEEFKKFDEFQKKHFAYINEKLYEELNNEDPDWGTCGDYLGTVMHLGNETMEHIRQMYYFGYTNAEQYWGEVVKQKMIKKKIEDIDSMFPISSPTKLKGNLKMKIQDSLNNYNKQDDDFLLEWQIMNLEECENGDRI